MMTVPGPMFDLDTLLSIDGLPQAVHAALSEAISDGARIHAIEWIPERDCGDPVVRLTLCAENIQVRSPLTLGLDGKFCPCGCKMVDV